MTKEQNMNAGDPLMSEESDEKLSAALASVKAMESAEAEPTADEAWTNFQAKLEAREDEAQDLSEVRLRSNAEPQVRASAWRRIRAPRTGLGWLATAQTAALAAMAIVLIPQGTPSQSDEYRTLSSDDPTLAQAPTGDAVLLFDGNVPSAQINETLNAASARIIDGPMANGGYVIEVVEGRLDSAVETLRASEGVLLVETLKAEGQS